MLGRMDGNRDRQISLAEHRAAMLANFDRLDTNRDGVVSPYAPVQNLDRVQVIVTE